ncbi:MAG: glycosyl transferase [Bacteroidales bacterium]|nr:glycosyl transferase [Bacteroidales bacterium]
MIPKKIHYCWFGRGPKPELALRCIESWKKYLPGYEIKEWNEDNFDLSQWPYAQEAYEHRRFAFVSDIARLYALYNEGGIYMDTDVEVVKSLEPLMNYQAVSGFESMTRIPTGLIASISHHPIIFELLNDYKDIHFVKSDGSLDLTTNVKRVTDTMLQHGISLNNTLQTIDGFTFLPVDYLCPKNYKGEMINFTQNTLVIHHFAGSWLTDEEKLAFELRSRLPHCPEFLRGHLSMAWSIMRLHNTKEAIKYLLQRLRYKLLYKTTANE